MDSPWDDLELVPAADDARRFRTRISDPWQLAVVPQGGIVAAVAAKAMAVALDAPEQRLRSLSAVFAGQVRCGPVEVEVQVLRRGRSISQLAATVRNPGEAAGLTAVAVFGASRRGFDFTELTFPEVPGPESLRGFRDGVPEGVDFTFDRPPLPFWEQVVDARPAMGRPPWEPYEPSPAEEALWYRLDDPPVTPDGDLDPLAGIVLCDTMPGAVGRRLGPDAGPWFGPSADFTFHWFAPARPGWLLAHNRARQAGDGYASVEMALWDPTGPTLVAHASQVMFFSFTV